MEPIQSLYKNLWLNYKSELKLAKDYTYIFGNPIKVHIPVDICRNSLMIIGAYPSAHFFTLDGINDIPTEDHYYPFSNEVYFDGIRYRPVKSGEN